MAWRCLRAMFWLKRWRWQSESAAAGDCRQTSCRPQEGRFFCAPRGGEPPSPQTAWTPGDGHCDTDPLGTHRQAQGPAEHPRSGRVDGRRSDQLLVTRAGVAGRDERSGASSERASACTGKDTCFITQENLPSFRIGISHRGTARSSPHVVGAHPLCEARHDTIPSPSGGGQHGKPFRSGQTRTGPAHGETWP